MVYSDILTSELLKKYNSSCHIKSAIKIFTKPIHNFISKEHNDLNKITRLINKQKIYLKTLDKLKKENPKVFTKLEEHQKKYYWIANNYKYTKCLNTNYFFGKIKKSINCTSKEHLDLDQTEEIKNIKRNISGKDIGLLKFLGKIAGLHDQRKKANLIANHWLCEFLKIIAKKRKISYSLLQFASFRDIINLLDSGDINLKEIFKRKENCMNIIFKGKKEYWLVGSDYKLIKKKITAMQNILRNDVIKGIIANSGKKIGRVKIILNVKTEGDKISKGDVLVTSMTRPEFIPLLNLASAIITDEGGITSHAAIVSREFNIPCIIGTKIATKVLKDGDLVEVDAERGIVKILKKNKT